MPDRYGVVGHPVAVNTLVFGTEVFGDTTERLRAR